MNPGHTFVFVSPDPGGIISGGHLYNQQMIAALRQAGCEVESVELAQAAERIAARAEACFVYDSLYLHPDCAAQLAPLPLEQTHSLFLAHHLHSLYPAPGRSVEAVYRDQEWPQLRRFAGIWTTSRFVTEYLAERGIDPARILTVEPAMAATTAGLDTLHTTPRVLLVANLIERKGVLALLRCLADHDELPEFELRILGGDLEPDYAQACRDLVAAHPPLSARVVFAGTQAASAMGQEYRDADLLVSAAAMETYGMALQEAMVHGLPLLLREGGYSARHLLGRGAGEVHESVEGLATSLLGLLRDLPRLSELKQAAHRARPALRSWKDAATSLLDQL